MRIEGLGPIERMGDVMVREVRPAEMVDVVDASGKQVDTYQAAPAINYVVKTSSFPWLWVAAGGLGILFLVSRPRPAAARFHRRKARR